MEFYSKNIQLDQKVIIDILSNCKPNTKLLVFGLGYDSKMWYEYNNKNTYFVENNDEYIKLNEKSIAADHIIKYNYTTTCATCMSLSDEQIKKSTIPDSLLKLAPFDIILIDGPAGCAPHLPGRLIPNYWSTVLCKSGGLIYVDDSSRPIEKYSIEKFYKNQWKQVFTKRLQCTKIFM